MVPKICVPSGKHTKSYLKWPQKQLIFPFNMVIFHSYVSLPEGISWFIPYTVYPLYIYLYIQHGFWGLFHLQDLGQGMMTQRWKICPWGSQLLSMAQVPQVLTSDGEQFNIKKTCCFFKHQPFKAEHFYQDRAWPTEMDSGDQRASARTPDPLLWR